MLYDKQPTKVQKWVKRLQNVLLQNFFGFWVRRTDTHLVSDICLRCHNVTAQRARVNVSHNFQTHILQYREKCKQEILLKNIYCFVLSANLSYASFYFSNSVAKRHFATFFSDVAIVSKANAYIKHEQYLVLKNVRLISEKLKLRPKNYSNFILVKAAKSCRNHIFLMKFLITGLT